MIFPKRLAAFSPRTIVTMVVRKFWRPVEAQSTSDLRGRVHDAQSTVDWVNARAKYFSSLPTRRRGRTKGYEYINELGRSKERD